jgi:hypothetical protein
MKILRNQRGDALRFTGRSREIGIEQKWLPFAWMGRCQSVFDFVVVVVELCELTLLL